MDESRGGSKRTGVLRYAVGEFGLGLTNHAVVAYAIFLYSDTLGLAAGLAGLARGINAVWDGVNDPLFGWLSDRTRTRLGRRRPWLLATLPLYLTLGVLIWAPPGLLRGDALFWYFLAALLLYEAASTIAFVNYYALFPVLFRGEQERVHVNAVRKAIGMVALAGGVALSPLLFASIGFLGMGLAWAGISALALAWFLTGLREPAPGPEPSPGFVAALLQTLRAEGFTAYLTVFALSIFALELLMMGIPFYAKYSLGQDETGTSLLFGAVFLAAIPGAFAWTWIARRLGARRAWITALVLLGGALLPLALVRDLVAALLCAALAGVGVAGTMVLADVILARIIDQDAARTGVRREGAFYGVAAALARLSGVLIALSFAALTPLFGYISGEAPGPDPDRAFRFFVTVLPGVGLGLAALAARALPGEEVKDARAT